MKIKKLLSVGAIMLGVILMTLSSCTTQKKVTRWLNEHPDQAAKYCANEFPVKEAVDTLYTIDSAGYESAYWELWRYADSLLNERSKVEHDTAFIERIRENIKTEIRYKLKPCIDSSKVIVKTVENTAKVKYLTGKIDEQISIITNMYNRNNELDKKLSNRTNYLWISLLIILCLSLYITRKLWLPILKLI